MINNTFTTPSWPIRWGADVVVHSLTKWSGGHGTGIGGILVDGGKFNWGAGRHPLFDVEDKSYGGLRWGHDLPASMAKLAYIIRARTVPLRNLGACIAPDNSWMFLQGLEAAPVAHGAALQQRACRGRVPEHASRCATGSGSLA
jgi:O-acetylhomoserine (thiol)-lyase